MFKNLKDWIIRSIEYSSKSRVIIYFTTSLAIVLTLGAYFKPAFGVELEQSTRWLGNVTPLVVLVLGYFLKEEIANWHYKKRSEAASEIIGKFRVCSNELDHLVKIRCLTPRNGEDAVERKVHQSVDKYVESCLEASSQFPIKIRRDLDSHFKKMKLMANTLSGAITITISSQPNKTFGEKMVMKARDEIKSIDFFKVEHLEFLDHTLDQYLQR